MRSICALRRAHHLRDVEHERTLGIAVTDSNGRLIVHGTLVEGLDTVSLGGNGRGEVDNNHLQKRVTSGKELPHDNLKESLALEVLLVGGKVNLELLEESRDGVLLEVHDGIENLEDGVEHEHVETTLKLVAIGILSLGRPLLGLGVEVRVTPELGHELLGGDTELLGVTVGELTKGEGPSVKSGTESDGSLLGVDLNVTERLLVVHGDDNVDRLDGTREGLVKLLLGDLKLEKSTINLVDDNDGLDALAEGLTEDSLGLNADTVDGVDDDESTIGDTEGGRDLGREIDVTGRIDQVDQELGTVGLLLDVGNVLLGELEEHGDGGRLDGDTTLLLIGTGVHSTRVSSLGRGDDTGLGQEGVGEG